MTIVIINIASKEIEHLQGYLKDYNITNFTDIHFEKWNLNPLDYIVKVLDEDYTLNTFGYTKAIVNMEIIDRPSMGIHISSTDISIGEVCTITNIPRYCEVFINGQDQGFIGHDGTLEIEAEIEGELTVALEFEPYLNEGFVINVT